MANPNSPLDLFIVRHPEPPNDGFYAPYREPAFIALPAHVRFEKVNRAMLSWILAQPEPCFLLVPFTQALAKLSSMGVLDSRYNQTGFESWLNRDSGLPEETNRTVRARLTGAKLPRDAYQWAFPVAGGRVHAGTHTVTAHNPPDIDTTTASFWSWVDAFACRVGTSLHVWNLPGGRPGEDVAFLFDTLLTSDLFLNVAKDRRHIAHEAIDILTRERFILARGATNLTTLRHNRYENAIVLVDDEGYFVGDWRLGDVDAVGRIRRTLTGTMREYLRQVTTRITQVFSEESPNRDRVAEAAAGLIDRTFSAPGEQTEDQAELDALLLHIFDLKEGTRTPLTVALKRLDEVTGSRFETYLATLSALSSGDLWDGNGRLTAPAPRVFRAFAAVHESLAAAVRTVGSYTLRMDVVMAIKHEVVGHRPHVVTTRATVEEIREKIGSYEHITVVFPAKNGRLLPVGTIHASDLERPVQGTVSLRDFANGGEIGLAGHLEVISVVDHHRIEVKTRVAPSILVSDVQSSNTLLALQAFQRFDAHSLRGQSPESVGEQLGRALAEDQLPLARRLLAKKEVAGHADGSWVHPLRERLEYTFYLHAILDDTDLLVKAGWRDLEVVAELLARLRGLEEGREIPLTDFGPDRSPGAIPQARRLLLKHPDLFAFYKKVGGMKAEWIDRHLTSPDQGALFEDTKIQSGRYSVGQTKLYPDNRPSFSKERARLLTTWLGRVAEVRTTQPQVDLFFHMVSTVHGPEESYHDRPIDPTLRDEIWIRFDRANDQAASLFRLFLARWRAHPKLKALDLRASAEGGEAGERDRLTHILGEVFLDHPVVDDGQLGLGEGVAILRFQAGTLNSRKADLTPYLPRPGGA